MGLIGILRCTGGHSFHPWWQEANSPALWQPESQSIHHHCPAFPFCAPKQIYKEEVQTPQTMVCEKYHNTSFCSKIKIHVSVGPHHPGPPRVEQKPLRTYLDWFMLFRSILLVFTPKQTSPMCALSKLSCSRKFRRLCWFLPRLAQNSLLGLKAPESRVGPPYVHHPVLPLQVLPTMLQEDGSLLREEQTEDHHSFSVFRTLSFSLFYLGKGKRREKNKIRINKWIFHLCKHMYIS